MEDLKKQNQNTENIISSNKEEPKFILNKKIGAAKKKGSVESIDNINIPEKKSASQIFMGFLFVITGLIVVAYIFILWSLVDGGLSNPLLEMLGMQPEELKLMLLTITNSLFGFISLIFVLTTLIKFFQWIITKSDSEMKKIYLKKMGKASAILFLVMAMWIGLYWVISNAEVHAIVKNNSESLIITTPSNTVGLTAPVSVKFDIGENLYKKIPEKFIRQIEWDLDGDDVYGDASGAIINYKFLNRGKDNGKFIIKAKVYYLSPASDVEQVYTDEREVIITNEAILSLLKSNVDIGAVPLTVRFSTKGSVDPDGDIVQYEWDFDGDGNYEVRGTDKAEVEHIFTQIGEHKVSVRITGQNNDYSVVTKKIKVIAAEEKIRANISSQNTLFEGVAPLTISLDGSQSYTKSGSIIKYEWSVEGEENSFIGRTFKRTFSIPGEYKVNLVVENKDGDRDTTTQKILVYEKREVVIKTSGKQDEEGNVEGTVPLKLTFDSSESEIPRAVEWKWDFENDGIYDEFSPKVDHVFREAGEYNVKLVISDSDNNNYESIKKIIVSEVGVKAVISAIPFSGEVPLKVEFDGSGSSTSSGQIIDYIWEFKGEKPIHYGSKISREFKAVGVFPVKLTVLSSDKGQAETEIFISVRGKSLQASFKATPLIGEAPLKVEFNSQKSTGNIKSYYWDFGDTEESYLNNPTHTYKVPGDYIVRLKITDSRSIISEVEKKITVTKPKKD